MLVDRIESCQPHLGFHRMVSFRMTLASPLRIVRKMRQVLRKRNFSHVSGADRNHIELGLGVKVGVDVALMFRQSACGNRLVIGNDVTLRRLRISFTSRDSEILIEDGVSLAGHLQVFGTGRSIRIGRGTTIRGATILARGADVSIGSDCLISREIEIRSTDVHKVRARATNELFNPPQPVIIGDHVWIGARALISKGVVLGDGCVVGAMTFVNKPFPEQNLMIAGIPARIVRRDIVWEK